MNIICPERVLVDLCIQHASACTILLFVACPVVQYFSTLSHKRHDFRKEKLLNIKCEF